MCNQTNTEPKVILGQYKSLRIPRFDRTVTEEDIQRRLEEQQKENAILRSICDRPVQKGDIATINFQGFCGGVAFEGGKGEAYPLEIGSGSFIPGFEEQIVGHSLEEEFNILVKFPEAYHSDDLAGKDAVFSIKILKIEVKEYPDIDDEFASEVSEYETLQEYKDYLRAQESARREAAARQAAIEQAVVKALDNAEISGYETLVDAEVEKMLAGLERNLSGQNLTLSEYLNMVQMTEEALRMQARSGAMQSVKTKLLLTAVAQVEMLEVTEEDIEKALTELGDQYGATAEQMRGAIDMEGLTQTLLYNKAAERIADTAVEE